jgi:REP element-mobilizing transposase RayT
VWVNATGNWSYFLDQVDRLEWLRLLLRVADRRGWTILAFCQMTTHIHGLFSVIDESLPDGMLYLNREYGKAFNERHSRVGRFARKRYGSRRIDDGTDLVGMYAYVALNPVKEGLCERAEDWRWSSYATTIGFSNDFPFVDASIVLAELDGSVEQLRAVVDAKAEEAVRARHVR